VLRVTPRGFDHQRMRRADRADPDGSACLVASDDLQQSLQAMAPGSLGHDLHLDPASDKAARASSGASIGDEPRDGPRLQDLVQAQPAELG